MNSITIKNYLLVIGDKVRVPGFEPLSEQTTSNLSIAMQGANTYIDVNVALDLIPGSKLIIAYKGGGPAAGSFGHDKWFEIPSGPPPDGQKCPSNCVLDSYKILQDYARLSLTPLNDNLSQECDRDMSSLSGNCDYRDFEGGLNAR